MKTIILSSALLLALTGGALAADPIINVPSQDVAPAGFIWTGGYVGIVAGVNYLKGDFDIPNYDPSGYNADNTSAEIGGKVGYNYQFANNFVLGGEASLVAVFNEGADSTFDDEEINVHSDWQAHIVAKVGYAADRFMPYVKGGIAFLHADDVFYSTTGDRSDPQSRTYIGWTIGAGVDYALNEKWIVGVDYAYAHFGSHDFANDQLGPTILKPSTHTVSASLSYKF
ncbi:outer membrane protein [Mesorhizobium sp. M0140]|uniref:outer membrane protein n=1 Tax=unclassified Mesorhizobium TaxID=325217 RepID=UPI00333A7867